MAREGGILAWQWKSYGRNHRDRGNLLLHMAAVPLFIASFAAAVAHAWNARWLAAVVCLLLAAFAFGVQAIGHKREAEAPIPFDGPGDFLLRVFVEQFITFPRFLLSGDWLRQIARPSGQA